MVRQNIARVMKALEQEKFAFSVTVGEKIFDVYHTRDRKNSRPVSIALRITAEAKVEVAVFAPGHLTEEAVVGKIAMSQN